MQKALETHELIAAASRLPTAARVISTLNDVLSAPDCDHERVCQLLQIDPAITSRLLRMANSAQAQRGYQVIGLSAAIEWLGLSQTYRVVCATLSGRVCQQDLPAYGISGMGLWRNSVASAVAMELLARKFRLDTQTAYTLGLFRNLGRILLQRVAHQRGLVNLSLVGGSSSETRELELKEFGCDHADAAAEIFKRWGLAELVSESIRHQYMPSRSKVDEVRRWASLVHLTILITEASDYSLKDSLGFEYLEGAVRDICGEPKIDFKEFVDATNAGCQQLFKWTDDSQETAEEKVATVGSK